MTFLTFEQDHHISQVWGPLFLDCEPHMLHRDYTSTARGATTAFFTLVNHYPHLCDVTDLLIVITGYALSGHIDSVTVI